MKNRLLNKIEEYKKLKFKIDKFIILYFVIYLVLIILFRLNVMSIILLSITFAILTYITYYFKEKTKIQTINNENVNLNVKDTLKLLKEYYTSLSYEIYEDKTAINTLFLEKNNNRYKVKMLNENFKIENLTLKHFKSEFKDLKLSKLVLVINKNIDKKIKKDLRKENIFIIDNDSLKFIKFKCENILKHETTGK